MKDDLISRKAALDWLEDEWDGMVVHVFDGIKNIPSAHCDNCPYPDQHVPQEDAVSRKALKDIFEAWLKVEGYNDAERNIIKAALYELQFAPSVMPVQRSFSCGQENDMISRQYAIEAILAVTGNSSVRELYEHVQEHGLSDMWSGGVNAAIDIIIALPSAQSEVLACGEGVLNAQPETARRIVGKSRNGMTLWYQCEMCNEPVDAQDNFCRGCGRRLIDE